jgi:GNAT superfamily N-acetyltransferase
MFGIRPVAETDRAELTRFYAALSADSRYARFLRASAGISDGVAASFCGPDHEHREGLVAIARVAGAEERIVGHLCLDPTDDGAFEMAVAVADGWRHRGIGRALLRAAIDWAHRHGIRRLRATMLATNTPVLALIRSVSRDVRLDSPECGVVEAVIDIGPGVPAAA